MKQERRRIHLEIQLDENSVLEAEATRMWSATLDPEDTLMGVKFKELPPAQQRYLNDWVRNQV